MDGCRWVGGGWVLGYLNRGKGGGIYPIVASSIPKDEKGKERKGVERSGKVRKGMEKKKGRENERNGKGRNGRGGETGRDARHFTQSWPQASPRKGKERSGKERAGKGKDRKGEGREGGRDERKGLNGIERN